MSRDDPQHRHPDFARDLMRMRPTLVGRALRLCRDRERAEDLASETIARAWAAQERFDGALLGNWLFTILRNQFITEQRRRRFESGCAVDGELTDAAIAPPQESYLNLRDVEDALARMPTFMSDALRALISEGTYERGALAVGIPEGTFKSRVSRGRQRLAEMVS